MNQPLFLTLCAALALTLGCAPSRQRDCPDIAEALKRPAVDPLAEAAPVETPDALKGQWLLCATYHNTPIEVWLRDDLALIFAAEDRRPRSFRPIVHAFQTLQLPGGAFALSMDDNEVIHLAPTEDGAFKTWHKGFDDVATLYRPGTSPKGVRCSNKADPFPFEALDSPRQDLSSPQAAFDALVAAIKARDFDAYFQCFTLNAHSGGESGLGRFGQNRDETWAELQGIFRGPLTLEIKRRRDNMAGGRVEAPEAEQGGIGGLTFEFEREGWRIRSW